MMTKSLEDYVETVYVLIRDRGMAHVRDVAKEMDVKMPSVVKAISELKKLGLVTQEPYSDIELTKEGRKVAQEILGRHVILKEFLLSIGVGAENADSDACHMEHILSRETMDCIRRFLKNRSAAKK